MYLTADPSIAMKDCWLPSPTNIQADSIMSGALFSNKPTTAHSLSR